MRHALFSTAALTASLVAFACDGPIDPPPESYQLADDVDVVRDSMGMVHIYAKDDDDLFYASGYMQAVDRLFQMDLTRRRAIGRRAEVLGPSYVSDDTIVRVVGIERWAREGALAMRTQRPDDYRLIVAWTAGVNARIDEVRSGAAPLPYGFGQDELNYMPEHWEPSDAFAVGKLILWGNANQLQFDLLATVIRDFLPDAFAKVRLMQPVVDTFVLPTEERPVGGSAIMPIVAAPRAEMPELPPGAAEQLRERLFHLVPSVTATFASNNWALDGRHTENGRPLIAGDPHQPLRSPSLFWMQHLNSADAGGSFDVAGFSFVGTPGVQLGHNRHVAWTATTNYPDISDIWEVRATASTARVGDQDVAIDAHEETIQVAGGDPVTITVEEVPGYGVLLPDDILPIPVARSGRRLLYRWTGFAPTLEASSFIAFDRAETLEDFEAAVDTMETGCFNFVGASADGIAYRSSPLVPDRGDAALTRDYWTMLDGDDAGSFWTGEMLGPDRLPHSRGGGRGWIASANNDPFGFTADGAANDDAWYFGVFFDAGTRSHRIEQRITELTAAGGVTADDMLALQMDTHSVVADLLLPLLEEAWAAVPTDDSLAEFRDRPELETLVTLLTGWDREMRRDEAAPVAFDMLSFFAAKLVLEDDFALVFDAILDEDPMYVIKWAVLALRGEYPRADEVVGPLGVHATLLRALDTTASLLTDRYGGVDETLYRWGDHHGSSFPALWGERLATPWMPTDGGVGTVNVSSANFLHGGTAAERLESTDGPLYRMVAGFGEDGVPQARVTVARGSSGDPDSPYFGNTTTDWIEGNYRPLLFTRAEVDADSAERLTIPAP